MKPVPVPCGTSITSNQPDDLRARLVAEPWPGNVRELRNALERAMILSDGDVLREAHLYVEPSATSPEAKRADVGAGAGESLADVERRTIEATLAEVGGNRRAAAAKLGIGLRTLYDKLKKYGVT